MRRDGRATETGWSEQRGTLVGTDRDQQSGPIPGTGRRTKWATMCLACCWVSWTEPGRCSTSGSPAGDPGPAAMSPAALAVPAKTRAEGKNSAPRLRRKARCSPPLPRPVSAIASLWSKCMPPCAKSLSRFPSRAGWRRTPTAPAASTCQAGSASVRCGERRDAQLFEHGEVVTNRPVLNDGVFSETK
jgi:hypothetical protein